MMLQAPDGGTTILPNPDFDNTEAVRDEVDLRRAMDGTFYSYVKETGLRELEFTFSNMGRGKMVELQEFFKAYAGEKVLFTDLYGVVFRVVLTENPMTFTTNSRSFNSGASRKESGSVTLLLVGEPI